MTMLPTTSLVPERFMPIPILAGIFLVIAGMLIGAIGGKYSCQTGSTSISSG